MFSVPLGIMFGADVSSSLLSSNAPVPHANYNIADDSRLHPKVSLLQTLTYKLQRTVP